MLPEHKISMLEYYMTDQNSALQS